MNKYIKCCKIGGNNIYARFSNWRGKLLYFNKGGNYLVIIIYGTCVEATVTVRTLAAGTLMVHTRTPGIVKCTLPKNGRMQGR